MAWGSLAGTLFACSLQRCQVDKQTTLYGRNCSTSPKSVSIRKPTEENYFGPNRSVASRNRASEFRAKSRFGSSAKAFR